VNYLLRGCVDSGSSKGDVFIYSGFSVSFLVVSSTVSLVDAFNGLGVSGGVFSATKIQNLFRLNDKKIISKLLLSF